jgi:hypothetical protein
VPVIAASAPFELFLNWQQSGDNNDIMGAAAPAPRISDTVEDMTRKPFGAAVASPKAPAS